MVGTLEITSIRACRSLQGLIKSIAFHMKFSYKVFVCISDLGQSMMLRTCAYKVYGRYFRNNVDQGLQEPAGFDKVNCISYEIFNEKFLFVYQTCDSW